ncbi:hypothetical protein [Mycobacterium sp.]|uniref:hypothetical protein n=1 Tax=Mycobacterium sp. TaxID=1785 RepID=UPI003C70F8F6
MKVPALIGDLAITGSHRFPPPDTVPRPALSSDQPLFTGRDAVTRFLARRAFAGAGDMVLVPTAANGQPAVAEYRWTADGVLRAHSIHVLDTGRGGVAALTVFLDPGLFSAFGLPPTR